MSWIPGKSPVFNRRSSQVIGNAIKKRLVNGADDMPTWPGLPVMRYDNVVTPFLQLRQRRTVNTGKNLPARAGRLRIEG